jgi:hypothetical protein
MWPWKVPKWPWFSAEVAVKPFWDLATLIGGDLFGSGSGSKKKRSNSKHNAPVDAETPP